jgi:hypothetical protein
MRTVKAQICFRQGNRGQGLIQSTDLIAVEQRKTEIEGRDAGGGSSRVKSR